MEEAMVRLDADMLDDLGLGDLPDEDKASLLEFVLSELEMRVGRALAEQMSDEQLDEFGAFVDAGDVAGARAWLDENFPNHEDTVFRELEGIKAEIAKSAGTILERLHPGDG